MYFYFFFFFFQAEDGIRDLYVTGVQTCALPICPRRRPSGPLARSPRTHPAMRRTRRRRSEERRVGKEWRSRWSPYHEKKKKDSSNKRKRFTRRKQQHAKQNGLCDMH